MDQYRIFGIDNAIRSGHFTKDQNSATLINELNNADKGIYMDVKHNLFIPKNRLRLMNNFKNPTISIKLLSKNV